MSNTVIDESLEYRPSLVGRLARIVIPVLQFALPVKMYRFVYDSLYNNYKKALRSSYILRVFKFNVTGDSEQKLRTEITRQLLPYTMGGWRALENAFEVTALAEKKMIEGALVECGVAEGGTAAMMAMANRKLGKSVRKKWFFDSYEGLPEPTEDDYQGGKAGHFIRPLPKGSCLGTIEQVSELLFDNLQFSKDEITLVKGWFQDTLAVNRDRVGAIAVLRLDGDWYESTKIPLENFYDQITVGGFVIIDDYATCFGSRKAVDEFRASRNITSQLHPDGRGGVWFVKEK